MGYHQSRPVWRGGEDLICQLLKLVSCPFGDGWVDLGWLVLMRPLRMRAGRQGEKCRVRTVRSSRKVEP